MKKFWGSVFLFLCLLGWSQVWGADDSAPPIERISMSQARATALRKVPGKVRDFEFKQRKDQWVYAFKIAGKDQRMHSVVVDALEGKIISKTSEAMPVKLEALSKPTPPSPKK
jgi:hypothetical protein